MYADVPLFCVIKYRFHPNMGSLYRAVARLSRGCPKFLRIIYKLFHILYPAPYNAVEEGREAGMRVRMSGVLWLFFAAWVAFGAWTVLFGGGWAALWAWLVPRLIVAGAAGLHETGHLLASAAVGVPMRGLSLDLFGARLEMGGMTSYRGEAVVAAGGPFFSLVSAAVAYPMAAGYGGDGAVLFFWSSLILGGVNLLPVGTLDGGRILRCLCAALWGDRVAAGVTRVCTRVVTGLLWLWTAYALMRVSQMLTLFAFSLCLLLRTAAGEETDKFF